MYFIMYSIIVQMHDQVLMFDCANVLFQYPAQYNVH